VRHPTCENFRAASKLLIQEWLSNKTLGSAVEVGCGASLLAEVLTERRQSLASITLSDISPLMLAYSNRYVKAGAKLVQASAEDLPLPAGSQESLVSCLGDLRVLERGRATSQIRWTSLLHDSIFRVGEGLSCIAPANIAVQS